MSSARQNKSPSKEEGRKHKAVNKEDNSIKEGSSQVSDDERTSRQPINQDLTDLSEVILMSRTSLEADTLNLTTQYHKDLVRFKEMLEERENHHLQAEKCINSLKNALDEKVEELRFVAQKLKMREASLEASMRHHNDLEEERAQLFKDLAELRGKLEKSGDQQTFNTAEGHIKSLESSLDEKEEVLRIVALEEERARLFKDLAELRGKLEESEDQQTFNTAEGHIKSLESSLDEKEEVLRIVALKEEKARLFKDLAELRGKLEKSEDQRVQAEGRIKSLESSLDEKEEELRIVAQKHQMSKASLEANIHYPNDPQEEKALIFKDLVELRRKLEKSENEHVQAEGRIKILKRSLDEKEEELSIVTQKRQEAAQLEGAVQRLEIENATLKAAAKQQSNKIDALQELAMGRGWLKDMATNFKSSKITSEQLSQEVQKQMLKSCSQLGLHLEEHEKEKGDLNTEMETEKKKAEKIAEQKRAVDAWLDDEMKRNTELQKEKYMLRCLLKTAKKKLRDQDTDRHSQADSAFGQMKKKVDNLEAQLEKELSRCSQLGKVNSDLKDQLTSLDNMSHLNDQLKRSKRQLEEEMLDLRCRMEAAQMEHSQVELYIERRVNQKLQQKLEEINISLQSQAASNKAFDQVKAANEANLRFQLEQKIQDLEGKLDQVNTTYHDSINQRDSICTELERYRQLYTDEMHLRKSLTNKLERANSQLKDASYNLHNQHNWSLITSNIPDRSLGGPLLNVELFGLTGARPQEPLPGTLSLHSPVTNRQSSRAEDYHTEMQRKGDRNVIIHHSCSTTYSFRGHGGLKPIPAALGEGRVHLGEVASPLQLDRNISKELNNARVELDVASARDTPVDSASRVELDPIAEQCCSSKRYFKRNNIT